MAKEILHNQIDRRLLKEQAQQDKRPKLTLSFYRYFAVEEPEGYRDQLYKDLLSLEVLGRVYVAKEGINAQISLPEHCFEDFKNSIAQRPEFEGIRLNVAVENPSMTFFDLRVRVKKKIVADGLEKDVDPSKGGKHLSAKEFNELVSKPDTLLVDMRNFYEAEVGHFQNALIPDADTFREALPMVAKQLAEHKDRQVVMYCTGGIRCEKASAYLIEQGFENVAQLNGGIINYAHQVRQEKLPNLFQGKNFVFDERLAENISNEVIGRCHNCGAPADRHSNCANDACHVLMLLCPKCEAELNGCCSTDCKQVLELPVEARKDLARNRPAKAKYWKSLRKYTLPNLLGPDHPLT